MEELKNNGVITVDVKVATVRYALNEEGECVVHSDKYFGMNAKKAAALIKKENKGKVIILDKSYIVKRYNVSGGIFTPSEEPEETEE